MTSRSERENEKEMLVNNNEGHSRVPALFETGIVKEFNDSFPGPLNETGS